MVNCSIYIKPILSVLSGYHSMDDEHNVSRAQVNQVLTVNKFFLLAKLVKFPENSLT